MYIEKRIEEEKEEKGEGQRGFREREREMFAHTTSSSFVI